LPTGLLVLALLLAAAALFTWRVLPRQGGALEVVPLAADKSLGVNTDLSGLPPMDVRSTVANVQASSFRWLRHRFAWDVMEPRRGSYD